MTTMRVLFLSAEGATGNCSRLDEGEGKVELFFSNNLSSPKSIKNFRYTLQGIRSRAE